MVKAIKAAILGVSFFCLGSASAEESYSFVIDKYHYEMLDSSLSAKQVKSQLVIVALWEITTPDYSGRWYVEVKGCDKPIGNITINSGNYSKEHAWSWDGMRAYDRMSWMHCATYALRSKK